MNADKPVSRLRDGLNSSLSHRHICVNLRSFAAKIPCFLITRSQPDAPRENPGPAHSHPAAKPGPTPQFKPSRIDPLNREPTANPGSPAPLKPFRTDPLNREPTPKPVSTVPFTPSRIDPSHPIPPRRRPSTPTPVAG